MYSFTIHFPKKDRYTLGQKCEQLVIEVLELLFEANAKRAYGKIPLLNKVDIKLKILKTVVRLSFDVKAIDQKKYLSLEKGLQEIGKMLGGWMKYIQKENPAVKTG